MGAGEVVAPKTNRNEGVDVKIKDERLANERPRILARLARRARLVLWGG